MTRPLYAYTYADVAFDDAIALLAHDPEGLLQKATDVSAEHGDRLVANLSADFSGFGVERDVVVELGEFTPAEQLRSVLPLRWRAARGHLLFPTVDATLEISALSMQPPVVQVTLAGSYQPPLGALGEILDRVFDRHLAEAVVHRFVEEVARRLEDLVAEATGSLSQEVLAHPLGATA